MPEQDIAWAVESITDREARYDLYDAYYEGQHRLLFATEKFRNTFGNLLSAFADNMCPTVVDAVADRLRVIGFDGPKAKAAQALWKRPRVPLCADEAMKDALKLADGYLLVWPDEQGVAQLWPQDPRLCTVEYDTDEPYSVRKAAKGWVDNEKHVRINLYYPDHIERYISDDPVNEGLAVRPDPAKYGPFRQGIAAEQPDGTIVNPYGRVPIFHFANNVGVGKFGRSELADVVPLQDALNKSVMDMLVAMEFVAYPQRYATGLEVETDSETGKPINPPFTPGVDRVWTASGDVKFGQFPESQLGQFVSVQDGFRKEICRVTGTPLHYLGVDAQAPSGEALKVTEARLVKKTEDRQHSFGVVLSDAVGFALRINGDSGSNTNAEDYDDAEAEAQVLWATAAPHNPLLDAEVQMVKNQLGVSNRQSLRELGYTDEQIQDMMDEQAADAQAKFDQQQQQASQQALLGSFTGSQGQTPQGSPGAPGSAGSPTTQEGGKVPLQAPKPRVTVGKDWFEG